MNSAYKDDITLDMKNSKHIRQDQYKQGFIALPVLIAIIVAVLAVGGVFVEIGAIPSSDLVKGLVQLDSRGNVIVDHKTQETSDPGIWAAGDVTDVLYKQNNISAGDAIKALLNIDEKLRKK